MWRGEGGGVGGGGGGGWGGGGGGGGGARVDIESIHHDVGTIVCRRDLDRQRMGTVGQPILPEDGHLVSLDRITLAQLDFPHKNARVIRSRDRSEEHTSELQSLTNLVCRLLLETKKLHSAT